MKSKFFTRLLVAATLLGFLQGCLSGSRPISPARPLSLTVSVVPPRGVGASFLGASQNEILYRVDGTGVTVSGTAGPFTAAPVSGSFSFSIDHVPSGNNLLLSLQLNDAQTHLPLAIGAVPFSSSNTDVTVDLGSVNRSCYRFNSSFTGYGSGYTYGFAQNSLNFSVTVGSNYDVAFNTTGAGFYLQDASSSVVNSVAYLGNGNLVNFDRVPSPSAFYSTSTAAKAAAGTAVTTLQTGDIYCVTLGTIANARAWVQITNPGTVSTQGPNFIFRANDQVPYFAYERTPGDISAGGNCDLYCPGVLGNSTYGSFANIYQPTVLWMAPVTTTSPVTLTGISFYSPGPSGAQPVTCETAVYTDVAGQPSVLLASTLIQIHGSGGWYTAPLSLPLVLLGSTPYWLCVHSDALNAEFSTGTSVNYTVPGVYGSLPALLVPTGITTTSYKTLVYGIYCY